MIWPSAPGIWAGITCPGADDMSMSPCIPTGTHMTPGGGGVKSVGEDTGGGRGGGGIGLSLRSGRSFSRLVVRLAAFFSRGAGWPHA